MSKDTEALANALLAEIGEGEALDICAVYEALAPLMPGQAFIELGANLELCPVHYCDAQICADDGEVECRTARGLTLVPADVLDLIGTVVERYELAMWDDGEDLEPLYRWIKAVVHASAGAGEASPDSGTRQRGES